MWPWLEAFGVHRCVMSACQAVGMSRSAVYEARETDQVFRKCWDDLNEVHNELLRSSMFNKAVDGWPEPVFHEGRICGYRQRFSVDLMRHVAKLRLPEYRALAERDAAQSVDEFGQQLRTIIAAMVGSVAGPPAPALEPRAKRVPRTVVAKARVRKQKSIEKSAAPPTGDPTT